MFLVPQNANINLDVVPFDYVFLVLYFVIVIAVGLISKYKVYSAEDFFLSGRSLPAWICALAFISANIGAVELIGQSANGARYGLPTVHYYWVGAIPAMVFLGLIMMPFYYGSKVRSVPEYLRLRFNGATHLLQSVAFAVATILIAGINLFALAILLKSLIGWELWVSILVAALAVMIYTSLGGLTAAVYNEVLQFFIIVAALIPLTYASLHRIGGVDGLLEALGTYGHQIQPDANGQSLSTWGGSGLINPQNPFGNWISIIFGLGFVTSFGYWTTNFTEVQRALSAKDMKAAKRTPILAAIPKMVLPLVIIAPGMIAAVLVNHQQALGSVKFGTGPNDIPYNDALPTLIKLVLPNGLVGLVLAGLIAAFMAGMAANVSAFNTVVTYDLWQSYLRPGRSDIYYLRLGRALTAVGVLIAVAAAFIAAGFSNLQDYVQQLVSIFNAPLFTTFIIGMFWKRMTPWAGFWGLIAGIGGAGAVAAVNAFNPALFGSDQASAFIGAAVAFIVDAGVSIVVSLVTVPKPVSELSGLVWGMSAQQVRGAQPRPNLVRTEKLERDLVATGQIIPARRIESTTVLGVLVLATCLILNLIFF